MPTHVLISEINPMDKDKIFVYLKNLNYVVFADREDLSRLRVLDTDEHKKPGVYILMDNTNRRYIGQASDAVIKRLNDHDKKKDWWTSVVFFGREDRNLDKSQLDYLEKMLIFEHSKRGFDMDNGDNGNDSFINFFQKVEADRLWRNVIEIFNIANFDLFEKRKITKPTIKQTAVVPAMPYDNVDNQNENDQKTDKRNTISIIDNIGNEIEGNSLRRTYIKWIESLYQTSEYRNTFLQMAKEGSSMFKTQEILGANGVKNTHKIEDRLYLFIRLNTKDTKRRIVVLAEKIGITVSINS